MNSSRVRLVCLSLAFTAWPMLARASATPLFELRVQTDKTEYVLGEPVRLRAILRNASSERLFFGDLPTYLSLTPPRGKTQFRGFGGDVRGQELAPGDSISFFLYPSVSQHTVTRDGVRIGWNDDSQTFARIGQYQLRVFCRPQSPRGTCSPEWKADRTESNEIRLNIRSPRRNEAPVVNALKTAHAQGNKYHSGVYVIRNGSHRMDDSFLDELRATKARRAHSPLRAYVDYAIARMLLDRSIEYPMEYQLDLGEAIEALETLRLDHPTFRPDEVFYHLAAALVCSEVHGLWYGNRRRGNQLMNDLLRRRPDLESNPDYALLAQSASQTQEDIEVRLQMDRREYVIGEPMLFRVALVNRSDRVVRVPSHSMWTPSESENFAGRIEIESSDGKRMLRMPGWPTHGGPAEGYTGMPLAAGDSVVVLWDRALLARSVEGLGYASLARGKRVLDEPGAYYIRVGVAPSPHWWHVWGAGRMVLSKPVKIALQEPGDTEKPWIAALEKARVDNIMGIGRDGAAISVLADAVEVRPNDNFNYHLQRGLAWAYSCYGPNQDIDRALGLLKPLESSVEGCRREWVLMEELHVLARADMANRASALHREEARRIVSELEKANPTIWADDRFCFRAFRALYGRAGAHADNCWGSLRHRSGFRAEVPVAGE